MLSMLHLQATLLCDLSVHLASPRAVAHESGDHTGLLLNLVLPTTGGSKSDGKRMLSWALLVPSTRAGQRKKRKWDQQQSNVHSKVLLCLNQGAPAPKPQCYGSLMGVSLTQPCCRIHFTFYKITPDRSCKAENCLSYCIVRLFTHFPCSLTKYLDNSNKTAQLQKDLPHDNSWCRF